MPGCRLVPKTFNEDEFYPHYYDIFANYRNYSKQQISINLECSKNQTKQIPQ